mmetsp:Transcript_17062/g.59722  ORF Transcript_17062/g.59722 Transcript_17062/m.59722 type:complete len:644 (-) Transcript_17062:88-2019(-)
MSKAGMGVSVASSVSDDEHDSTPDQGVTPDKVKRHVTDCPCCVLFLACLGGLGYVFSYALTHGTPENYAGLPLASGEICGVTLAVKDKPFLFFCQGENGTLSYADAVCVAGCGDNGCKNSNGVLPEYTAEPFAGLLCMPDLKSTEGLAAQSMSLVTSNPNVERLLQIKGMINAWPLLAGSAATSMVAGFLFLFFLEKCTGCLVWMGFAVLVLSTGGFGGTMAYAGSQPGGLDGLPSTGDSQQDLAVGAVSCALSFFFLCLACCKRSSVSRAVECVKSAAECIEETPSILIEPLLALILKIVVIMALMVCWVYLLSCAKSISVDASSGIQVEYTTEEKAMIGFLFLMSLWLLEFCNALSTYVISYVTQMWFFKVGGGCSVGKAYCSGLAYHSGSLAFGSLLVALVRGVRIVLSVAAQAMKDTGNSVGWVIASVCTCFVSCFERFLEKLNKFAYMDIAINSNSFCTAAGHAMSVLTHNATAAITLQGATFLFEIAGVGGITAAGSMSTYMVATNLSQYNDPTQETYVEDPVFLAVVSAVLCFFVSLPFMLVFSSAADTVLFCFALERTRTPKQEEEKSFIHRHFTGCLKQKPSTAERPKYDDSRHSEKTKSLLDAASNAASSVTSSLSSAAAKAKAAAVAKPEKK